MTFFNPISQDSYSLEGPTPCSAQRNDNVGPTGTYMPTMGAQTTWHLPMEPQSFPCQSESVFPTATVFTTHFTPVTTKSQAQKAYPNIYESISHNFNYPAYQLQLYSNMGSSVPLLQSQGMSNQSDQLPHYTVPYKPNDRNVQPSVTGKPFGYALPIQYKTIGSTAPVPFVSCKDNRGIIPVLDGMEVPQRMYRPTSDIDMDRYVRQRCLLKPLKFQKIEGVGHGIRVVEILSSKEMLDGLTDADSPAFEGCRQSASIRINWPGYSNWTQQLATLNYKKERKYISRQKAAHLVAQKIKRFFDHVHEGKVVPVSHEFWESEFDDWVICPGRICLENIVLVSLDHVSQGSWQPKLRISYDQ